MPVIIFCNVLFVNLMSNKVLGSIPIWAGPDPFCSELEWISPLQSKNIEVK